MTCTPTSETRMLLLVVLLLWLPLAVLLFAMPDPEPLGPPPFTELDARRDTDHVLSRCVKYPDLRRYLHPLITNVVLGRGSPEDLANHLSPYIRAEILVCIRDALRTHA